MQKLPDRANSDHLKKQAKDLLRRYQSDDDGAIERFARALPAAQRLRRDEIVSRAFRLRDAQSCIAREYGFSSWGDLMSYVAAQKLTRSHLAVRLRGWLALVYGGDVTGSLQPARPRVALRVLLDAPDLVRDDPYVACAAGHEALLRQTTAADPAWVNRPGGPFNLPPLVAVTHSCLGQLPEFRDKLYRSTLLLLQSGADPNQTISNRFPPASLATPDVSTSLPALYGAAGVNRDLALTTLLLDAGANPNDGESLYHSLENLDCTRALLTRGARVAGTNALRRSLDIAAPAALELLLAHGGDPNEAASGVPTSDWDAPLLRAIALRRARHAQVLLAAGADPSARTLAGISAYRLAMQTGLPDVAELLRQAGAAETLSQADEFIAACARGDAAAAGRIKASAPDLPGSLGEAQLRLLPDTVAWGSDAAARVMVELGWTIGARGGDWQASALNLAVFRGDAGLADFLLAHGAKWPEQQGFGDDVLGTLSWASINEPVEHGDWAGCARALAAHGLPTMEPDAADPEAVTLGGRRARLSADVVAVLLGAGAVSPAPSTRRGSE